MKNKKQLLKNGDILFQKNKFNIKDKNTYLSPIIHFGINFWNRILDKPLCPVHHCGVLFQEYSTWYVYEAKSEGIVKTPLDEKLNNKDITILTVKRYSNLTAQDGYKMKLYADTTVKVVKYDFWSIFLQFFRQLFNEKVDLATNPNKFKNKKMNCCEFVGETCKTVGIQFKINVKSLDPEDLYFDDRSDFVMFLK